MGLNLRKREIPLVTFRRDLPDWLADGEPCFIEIDARAGGPINPDFVARMEQVELRGRVVERKLKREGEDEAYVKAERAGVKSMGQGMFAAIYDACVIEWRSNIVDGDAPITCDRERFLALAELQGVPEIGAALIDFQREVIAAGKAASEDEAETTKN